MIMTVNQIHYDKDYGFEYDNVWWVQANKILKLGATQDHWTCIEASAGI